MIRYLIEPFILLQTACKAALFSWKEERKVKKNYYNNPRFKQQDQALKKEWRWINPYAESRRFLARKGESEIHTYGETPLTVFALIAERLRLKKEDLFLDLGCGRGRGVFFLQTYFGCKAYGVDWVPSFIHKARSVARSTCCSAGFELGPIHESKFIEQAQVIYLAWTCIEEEERAEVEQALVRVLPGTQVITISYPLQSQDFTLSFTSCVSFPWGEAEIFFHVKH